MIKSIRRFFWRFDAWVIIAQLCSTWSAEQRSAYLRDLEAAYFDDFGSAADAIEEDMQYWGEAR